MPIAATDLLAYNCVSRPTDDTSTAGGDRDVDVRPGFTQLAANDDLEILSSSASDTTQVVTVEGRDAAGAIVNIVFPTLTGVTPVTNAQVFERVLFIDMDADAVGTVTIRRAPGGATVYAIPIGEQGSAAMFQRSASESGATTRYDKMFWLNNHGSLTLNSAQVQLTADPSSVIRQGVHTARNDAVTITDRETAPGGVTFVDDSVLQSVPGTILPAADDIGVWIEMLLAADNAPISDTFTTELSGTSA